MYRKKSNKGITLIALVITIIVLLILAAVSLAMLTGENGILTRAKLSKSKTEEGVVREEVELAIQEILIEKGHKEELTINKISEYLAEKLDGITIIETTDNKIKIEYKGYEIEIESDWKVKVIGKAGITVTYTTEPAGYAKESVEIILNMQTREGVSVTSVVPEETGVEVIEANKRFKVTENKVYKFKLIDNSRNERTIQVPIDNIDREAPNAQIEWITKMGITNSTLKAKVTITDDKSEVDLEKCKWVLKDSETLVGKDIANYTGGNITNEKGEIETGTIAEAKKYYMHILVTDKVGNAEEYCSEEIDVKSGYAISTPQEFQNMKNDLAGNYYVVNDIDMKDFNFTMIPGNFTGTLDGQGFKVSNLNLTGDSYASIFYNIGGKAEIKNLVISDVSLNCKKEYSIGAVLAMYVACNVENTNILIQKVGITGTCTAVGSVNGFVSELSTPWGSKGTITFLDCYCRCNLVNSSSDYGCTPFITFPSQAVGSVARAERCYWSGVSTGRHRTGSIISFGDMNNENNQKVSSGIVVKDCYYDKEKFPVSIAPAISGTGLTTEEMKKQENYKGWDFESTWKMGKDGYPELRFDKNT